MLVARVPKFSGAKINVAGSSFMININSIAKAANEPGVIKGILMFFQILKFDAPRVLADSPSLGLICNRTGFKTPIETGRNKIRYPIQRIVMV